MASLIVIFCVGVVALVVAIATAFEQETGVAAVAGIIAIVLFAGLTFWASPAELGWTVVPDRVENFAKRLDTGVAYQVVSSSKEGPENFVLLVKKFGTSDFSAIRVKKDLPEIFTLVDGKPVAIVPAAPVVSIVPSPSK